MRVISGKYRNRSLKADDHFRPTSDRVRESLFNILQSELEDCVFVDAFAGSGAVGIEALSRGARMVYFLENHRKSLAVLEQNLIQCGEGPAWRIYSLPVPRSLDEVRRKETKVDIIFYDPPYDFRSYAKLLESSAGLFPEALHILEASARAGWEMPPILDLIKDRTIGETRITFFRANPHRAQS